MMDLYLHPDQVREMIKMAQTEDEVIVIRCVRKGAASKAGGPDAGELYDLHCAAKPKTYKSSSSTGLRDRKEEDKKNGVLTVFVTNRKDPVTELPGAWRRVNLNQVKKVIYKAREYEIKVS